MNEMGQAAQNQVPRPGLPNVMNLVNAIRGTNGSRTQNLENFIGNFITAFSSGMSQTGRGANARGFAAAIGAPYQLALQRYQLGQQQQLQQAQTQEAQAKTGLEQQQTKLLGTNVPITLPNGQQIFVPANQAGQVLRGLPAAQVSGQAKITAEQIKLMAATGQISKLVPSTDAQGNFVMRALNKFGQPIGDIDGALPPASYLPKTSSTVEYKQMDDGSIVALPKSTTTAPKLPTQGGAIPKAKGGGSAPRTVTNAQGQPLIGKGAITGTTRTMVETAPKVLDLVNRLRGQIQQLQQTGQLGPGMGRWNDFWSGKIGSPNPEFRAMKTNADLLSTLLMRMHVGARGGEQIMEHFDKMIDAGKQSPENMLATLDQLTAYAKDVAGAGQLPANFGKANQTASPVDSLVSKYK